VAVTVGLVVDQGAAEIVAGRRIEFFEKGAQIVIHGSGPPSDRSIHPGSPVEFDRCFAWRQLPRQRGARVGREASLRLVQGDWSR
jgi:hypothetical protein